MNLLNTKIILSCIRVSVFIVFSFVHIHVKAFTVDMSRRQKDLKTLRLPASIQDQTVIPKTQNKTDETVSNDWASKVVAPSDPSQDIVILSTENGFVPETLKLKKGFTYKIHVVNVNEKDKNTSFVLDAFSQQHATYFGAKKTFSVSPQQDGVFSFLCPETAKQGKIVVFSDDGVKPIKKPKMIETTVRAPANSEPENSEGN